MSSSLSHAQGKLGEIGKIFSKEEADQLFGKVIGSVQITKAELKKALASAKDYVLFTVKNNRALVMNEKKQSLTMEKVALAADEVAHIYSKSKVEEFLSSSKTETIYVERRAEVLSLTSGLMTLEGAWICPPFCD